MRQARASTAAAAQQQPALRSSPSPPPADPIAAPAASAAGAAAPAARSTLQASVEVARLSLSLSLDQRKQAAGGPTIKTTPVMSAVVLGASAALCPCAAAAPAGGPTPAPYEGWRSELSVQHIGVQVRALGLPA
jgi:hypothetical protein